MSHSKDKDFNETGKWQEAFFFFLIWLRVTKQIGSFKVTLPLCIEIFQAT